jgi:hypothetical protein
LVSSSSEVNSPVSFKPTKNIEDIVEELDEIIENLDLGESLGYSNKGSNKSFDNYLVKDLTTKAAVSPTVMKTHGGQKESIPPSYIKCAL